MVTIYKSKNFNSLVLNIKCNAKPEKIRRSKFTKELQKLQIIVLKFVSTVEV